LPVISFFAEDEDGYLTGEIIVICDEGAAYYEPEMQTYVLYAKWKKVTAPEKVKLTSVSNNKANKISVKFKK